MSKKGIIFYISLVLTTAIGLLVCVTMLLYQFFSDTVALPKLNLFDNSSNYIEIGIPLDVESVTDENNVFKTPTDLEKYANNQIQNEVYLYPVLNEDGSYSYVNTNDELPSTQTYEYADFFIDGLAVISKENLFGFINENFQEVIPPQYKYVYSDGFVDGLAVVVLDNEDLAVINKNNEIVLSGKYDYIDLMYEGIIVTEKGSKMKHFTRNGKELTLPKGYSLVSGFKNGLAQIMHDKNYNVKYINESGQTIKMSGFDEYDLFNNGLAIVSNNKTYDSLYLTETLTPIYLKDEYMSLDIYSIGDGIASVTSSNFEDNPYKYINLKGDILFSSDYSLMSPFKNGIAHVYHPENGHALMSNKGEIIKNLDISYEQNLTDELYLINNDGYYGAINLEGQSIIEPKYYYLSSYNGIIEGNKDENFEKFDLFTSTGHKINSDNVLSYYVIDSRKVYVEEQNQRYYFDFEDKSKIFHSPEERG